MTGERTLPGIGLTGYWNLGDSTWKPAMDINLRSLSALVQLTVKTHTTALPGSPTQGDIHIVPSGAGVSPNAIAVYDSSAWVYITPGLGWRAFSDEDDAFHYWTGTAWALEAGTPTLAGDVTGLSSANSVIKLQNRALASTAPSDGQAIVWDATGTTWKPGTVATGTPTLAGDVTGLSSATSVVKLQSRALASTAPSDGQAIVWDATGTTWKPGTVSTGTPTLAGDVTGLSSATSVVKLQGRDLASTAPSDGQAIVWDASGTTWKPGGGTSTISPVYKGARVTKTVQSVPSASTATITWSAAERDTNSFWSSGANTRLTIPSGVSRVKVRALLEWATSGSMRFVTILKNGTQPAGTACFRTVANEGDGVLETDVLDVTAGDYFEVSVYNAAVGALNVGTGTNGKTWFAIEVVEGSVLALSVVATSTITPTWKGCVVRKSANQTLANNTGTMLTWDTEDLDTSSFHDTVTNNTRLTIPSGVSKVRVYAGVRWSNLASGGVRQLYMFKNGATFQGRGAVLMYAATTVTHEQEVVSAVLSVSAGDYFEIGTYQDSGGSLDVLTHQSTWATLDVLEGSILNQTVAGINTYDVPIYIPDRPTTSMLCARIAAVRAFDLPASLTGSVASAGTAATGSTVFTIYKNTTSIGTITFAAAGTTGTFSFASAVSFVSADLLRIIAPATADTTLADISITLMGSRT
jgi:hypothetical protein